MTTMKAIVVEQAGRPDVLQIKEIPRPQPQPGWVVIAVKAFGLNRSELFTWQGHSPSVQFPRVLGIECVGIVESAPQTAFKVGQKVAAIMGGMGREFDGGYAEYTCVPEECVFPVETDLAWAMTGILGGEWTLKEFTLMGVIPSTVKLTVYAGDAEDLDAEQLQRFVGMSKRVAAGSMLIASFTSTKL